ncbi:hypothetical protein ONZ45_g13556 [Pleurotus djamor]|nr:hypothetical protein ONZ45_g13556 [Pleurotus djamor]
MSDQSSRRPAPPAQSNPNPPALGSEAPFPPSSRHPAPAQPIPNPPEMGPGAPFPPSSDRFYQYLDRMEQTNRSIEGAIQSIVTSQKDIAQELSALRSIEENTKAQSSSVQDLRSSVTALNGTIRALSSSVTELGVQTSKEIQTMKYHLQEQVRQVVTDTGATQATTSNMHTLLTQQAETGIDVKARVRHLEGFLKTERDAQALLHTAVMDLLQKLDPLRDQLQRVNTYTYQPYPVYPPPPPAPQQQPPQHFGPPQPYAPPQPYYSQRGSPALPATEMVGPSY